MSNMMYYTIYRACTKQDKGCDISGKSQPPKISAWIDIHQFYFVGQKFFITLYPKSEDYGSYRSICPSFNFRSAA